MQLGRRGRQEERAGSPGFEPSGGYVRRNASRSARRALYLVQQSARSFQIVFFFPVSWQIVFVCFSCIRKKAAAAAARGPVIQDSTCTQHRQKAMAQLSAPCTDCMGLVGLV